MPRHMDVALLADLKDIASRMPPGALLSAGGFTFVAFLGGLAWASGALKLVVNMLSIAIALGVAWWVFRHRADVFGASAAGMGVDRLLVFSGGLGVVAYGVARVLLKVTGGFGLLRLAAMGGWKGVLVSLVPSGFFLWMSTMVLRFLGNLYGMESASHLAQEGNKFQGHFGEVFNEARRVIDRSAFSSILNQVDPLSIQRTGNLARLLIVWPEKRLWPALSADAETRKVFSHPKVAALGHDSAVRACIDKKDYPGLLQLSQVEQAAAHQDLEPLLTSPALEASMDKIIYGRNPK
jgi:hypothetical protein